METTTGSWIREASESPVPLALDESLSMPMIDQWLKLDWPGYWIIKPSIMGNPGNWMSLLEKHKARVILSSVFETGIGLSSLVNLSEYYPDCIHGLGTQDYFNDKMGTRGSGPSLEALSTEDQEEIWNRLPAS